MEMPHEVYYKCRMCMEDLAADCKDIRNSLDIQQKMKELYNLLVTPQDKCTTKICINCHRKFVDHNNFKQQIAINQSTLAQYMKWNDDIRNKQNEIVTIDDDDDVDDKRSLSAMVAATLPPTIAPQPTPTPSPKRPNLITPPLQYIQIPTQPPMHRTSQLLSQSSCMKVLESSIPPQQTQQIPAPPPISQSPSSNAPESVCADDSDNDIIFVSETTKKTPTPPFIRIKEIVKRQCPRCSQEFEHFSEVTDHITRVHSGKQTKCKFCEQIIEDKHRHMKECAIFLKLKSDKKSNAVPTASTSNLLARSTSTTSLEPVPMELEEEENLLVPMEEVSQPSKGRRRSRSRARNDSENEEVEKMPAAISKRRNTDYFTVPPWETEINQEVIQAARRTGRSKSVYQPSEPEPEPEPVLEELPKKKRGRPRSKSIHTVKVDKPSNGQVIPINFQTTDCIPNGTDRTEVVAKENNPNAKKSKVTARAPLHNVSNVRCSKQKELTKRLDAFLRSATSSITSPSTSIPKDVAEKHMTPRHTPAYSNVNITLEKNATSRNDKRKTPHHLANYDFDLQAATASTSNISHRRKTPHHQTNYEYDLGATESTAPTSKRSDRRKTPHHETNYDYELGATASKTNISNRRKTPHHQPTYNYNLVATSEPTASGSNKRKTPHHEPTYNHGLPEQEPTKKTHRKTPRHSSSDDNGPNQTRNADSNPQHVYSFAVAELPGSRNTNNQEPTYILKPSSTNNFAVSVSNEVEPSTSKNQAIVMKITKQAGEQANYVSNIIAGDHTPLQPPPSVARIAHVPNNTAPTATSSIASKDPQTAAPAKINNMRRKSSISERKIHQSTSGPNLVDNIIENMMRSAGNTSDENVSAPVAAPKTLKVLTPVQLNNSQLGQPQQRQQSPNKAPNPHQQSNQHQSHHQQVRQQPQQQQPHQQPPHQQPPHQQQSYQQQPNQLNQLNQQQSQQQSFHQQPSRHQNNLQSQNVTNHHQQPHRQKQYKNNNHQQYNPLQHINTQFGQQQQQQTAENSLMNHQPTMVRDVNRSTNLQFDFQRQNTLFNTIPGILESTQTSTDQSTSMANPSGDALAAQLPSANASPNSTLSHLRHFHIKLCKIDSKKLGLKIHVVGDNQEVQVSELSNAEKKLLRESILETTFYKGALKVFLKSDCTHIREQLNDIFMNKVPDELAMIIGLVKPASNADRRAAGLNFYNERIDDDLEILN